MPDILPGAEGFPRTEVLSSRVHRVLGLNPSLFTGPGTNTYLLGVDQGDAVLIDTGSGLVEYSSLLQEHLAAHGNPPLRQILLTHVHPDHIGGVESIREFSPKVPVYKHPWPDADSAWPVCESIADGDVFSGAGYTLRAIHTPGHALDHICFYLEEEKALFTGDVILGVGTTVIPQNGGDLGDYLETLRKLLTLDVKRLYPGHGPVIEDGPAKIQEYLSHRLAREAQVLTELEGGSKTVEQVVRSIYREYPEHLYAAAGQSILSHLDKLVREGRVARNAEEHPVFSLLP